MRAVILNWSEGENDPFSLFNENIRYRMEAQGIPVSVLSLDQELSNKILSYFGDDSVAFTFTWQGLGSNLRCADGQVFWDKFRVPLVCYHGDHPCHAMGNHQHRSGFVHHWYAAPSFARFANKWVSFSFSRYIQMPQLFAEKINGDFEDSVFMFAKNYDDLSLIEDQIKSLSSLKLRDLLLMAKAEVTHQLRVSGQIDHHELIDSVFSNDECIRIVGSDDSLKITDIRLFAHAFLDKVYRNGLSCLVLEELKDFKVRVLGRGWGSLAGKSSNHEFFPGKTADKTGIEYFTKFGVIDVSASFDAFHDRSMRAMSLGCGFLSGSEWFRVDDRFSEFGGLFFNGARGLLAEKAAEIQRNPGRHRDQCREFSRTYNNAFSFADFFQSLASLGVQSRA